MTRRIISILIILYISLSACDQQDDASILKNINSLVNVEDSDSIITVQVCLENNTNSDFYFLLTNWCYTGKKGDEYSALFKPLENNNLNSISYSTLGCKTWTASLYVGLEMDSTLSNILLFHSEDSLELNIELPKYIFSEKSGHYYKRFQEDSIYFFEIKFPTINKSILKDITNYDLNMITIQKTNYSLKAKDLIKINPFAFTPSTLYDNKKILISKDAREAIDDNINTLTIYFEYKACY